MIGSLKGVLINKTAPDILLDVQGVGYEVTVPMTTYYQLPEVNQPVFLLIHLAIREDAHVLYGFADQLSRQLFKLLIKVSGVGPKLALTLLSGMDAMTLFHTLEHREVERLVKLPGVGKKTAERLVIELRDQVQKLVQQSPLIHGAGHSRADYVVPPEHAMLDDAISALVALGYKPNDASKVVKQLSGKADSSEALIRLALQQMVG